MNKHLFYGSSIACLSTLFGCDGIAFKEKAQPTDISSTVAPVPSPSHLVTNPQTQQPISLHSASSGYLSIKSPVPVVPLAVSKEEIALREKQVKIAEENQRAVTRMVQAGVGTYEDKLMAEYFVLSNKIRLLQAKQLLQLRQQQKEDKNNLSKI